jgi:integrase
MSAVFNHAFRHEWMHYRSITKVRTSAKRLREPDVLTSAEFAALVHELPLRENAMVMLAGITGLLRSKRASLTWRNVDPVLMQVNVLRPCVRGRFWDTKTEASRKLVPLRTSVIECLYIWRKKSPYQREDDFLFPSVRNEGKSPVTPDMILQKIIRPALVRAKIPGKAIGWHSFRHSLATNLRTSGANLKPPRNFCATRNHGSRLSSTRAHSPQQA